MAALTRTVRLRAAKRRARSLLGRSTVGEEATEWLQDTIQVV
jgi:hypothetical protein